MKVLAWVLRNTLYRNRMFKIPMKLDDLKVLRSYMLKLGKYDVIYLGNGYFIEE